MMRRLAAVAAVLLFVCTSVWADRPHIDYTTVTKTVRGSVAATDTAFWTPASGEKIILMGCAVESDTGGQTIEIEISDIDVIPPQRFESSGLRVISGGGAPIYETARDAVLRYTVSSNGNFSIMCWGYETP